MDNYSLSDLAAVTGNENGFGGGNSLIWVILFIVLLGGNLGGLGSGIGSNAATAATQQEILYGQQFQNIGAKLNDIGKGICDSTFALNNTITGEGRALQTQLAQCCCETQRAIHEEGEATRALLKDNEIQNLRDKVNDLQRETALCGVVRYPTEMNYVTHCNPFCGCGNGCYQNNI